MSNVLVRPARVEDIEEIVDLIKEWCHNEWKWDKFSVTNTSITVANHIGEDNGVLIVAVAGNHIVGIISGYITNHPICDRRMLLETGFFVRSDFRNGKVAGRLLKTFEDIGKANKVDEIGMCAMTADAYRYMERKGYEPLEAKLIKRI